MQTLNNNNVKLAQAMVQQDHHLSSFISTVDKRFNNVMSAVQKKQSGRHRFIQPGPQINGCSGTRICYTM